MHLKFRNVNYAFEGMVELFHTGEYSTSHWTYNPTITKRPSRNGNVLMIEEPILITYTHPKERVLFNTVRDANPFLHMYEALWMLAGRNDVDSVAYYCNKMREFSDDGKTLNGAYGYRWRYSDVSGQGYYNFVDQLDLLVAHLKANPDSRRAVLSMWNVENDLLKVDSSKDVCCNLNVMFSIRGPVQVLEGHQTNTGQPAYKGPYLDMTVTNRSNDMIWGLLGANYVHFTILQEYMAARLGVEVGVYNHFTNNLHVYEWNWKPEEWLSFYYNGGLEPHYFESKFSPLPLVKDPARFDIEVDQFVVRHSKDATPGYYEEPFLTNTAEKACLAWHYYKRKELDIAIRIASMIEADDWRMACKEWLQRRMK